MDNFFAGNYYSDGGVGSGGESGAAGTVYTKDNSTADGQKTLRIYNREGPGVGLFIHEPGHEKTCLMSYGNNKGADQPAHRRSLISAFVVRCLDSIISLDYIAEISRL